LRANDDRRDHAGGALSKHRVARRREVGRARVDGKDDLHRETLIRRGVALIAALLLAGCNGGTVDRQDLSKDAGTLDSIACEGAMVADGVARSRTTVFYAREQTEELRVQTSNLA